MIWSGLIDLVRALVFAASHVCGNSLGDGILLVSFAVRIALLPMTLRVARRMRDHQAHVATLAPEMERLRLRYRDDRTGLAQATTALYERNDLSILPRGVVSSSLIQLPIGAALYRAFATGLGPRAGFLWIGDLARPDAVIALLSAVLAGVAVGAGPSTSRTAIVTNMLLTGFLAWRLSASVGLYWVASNSVGAVQSIVLRRAPAVRAG
ncbi:MAG: YidC/Oxa1 family membrane protein insertase [Gemmatimonadota bacterium]|nr:YidC/Oxa1 family membrane protein insertase [Gemmatimonadota bacterium]